MTKEEQVKYDRIVELLYKKLKGEKCTEQQEEELRKWCEGSIINTNFLEGIEKGEFVADLDKELTFLLQRDSSISWKKIQKNIDKNSKKGKGKLLEYLKAIVCRK